MPSLTALRTFWSVARKLSMQLAADELCVSPSAVSHQIKALESHLQTRLFDRHVRGLTLTESGERLFQTVDGAFVDIANTAALIQKGLRTQLVSVAATPLVATKWLVPRLRDFETENPDIQVQVNTLGLVRPNKVSCDIAIAFNVDPSAFPSHEAYPLFGTSIVPACSPGHFRDFPVASIRELGSARLLQDDMMDTEEWIPGWETFLSTYQSAPTPVRIALRFSSAHLALEAALAGMGWTLAVLPIAEHEINSGHLICPFADAAASSGTYWLFVNKASAAKPPVKAFAAWLRRR